MKTGNFDISNVSKDGYLIFPLSMSRLATASSGKALYDFIAFFESKVSHLSNENLFARSFYNIEKKILIDFDVTET